MLSTHLKLADKYDYLEDKFALVYKWLRENADNIVNLPDGRIDLDGDNVYVMVQSYVTGTNAECRFETHKNYFDVQYVAAGIEAFGYEPRENLTVSVEYNPANDVMFYAEPEHSGIVVLHPGDLIIVAPEDGHAPRRQAGGPCEIKKVVAKVHI